MGAYMLKRLIETFEGHSFQCILYSKLDFSHFQMYIESIKKIDIIGNPRIIFNPLVLVYYKVTYS